MGRTYQVKDPGGKVISIHGDLGGFLSRWATMFPRYVNRVLRHAAYKTQMRMKAELLAAVPGGERIPDITWVQRVRALDYYRKYNKPGRLTATGLAYNMNGGEWPIGGKLAQAIGYEMRNMAIEGKGEAHVGWLSWSAAALGRVFQEETRTPVTPTLRRLYAAAGIPLKPTKTVIVKPARPIVEPFYRNRRGWIAKVMETRFRRYIEADAAFAAKRFATRVI
jgi:hypothetical protein